MNTVVERLERELLPSLNEVAEDLRTGFPRVKVFVRSEPAPAGDGHHFYISCLLADASPGRPDLVDLMVTVYRSHPSPSINADVCWGECGYIEAEFSREPVIASEEVLRALYADLPRLYAALKGAMERGRPSGRDEPHA